MKLDIELIAFFTVFAGIFLASCLTPQHIMNKYEWKMLLLVGGPFLGWTARILLRGQFQSAKTQ